jgi:hypothetical protein
MPNDLIALIDESIRLELNVSDLYFLFHKLFSEDAAFWWRLVQEEKNHAALLRSGKEYFEPLDRFPVNLLHTNIGDLKNANQGIRAAIDRFGTAFPSRAEALAFALSIENNAGEIHFQHFMEGTSDSPVDRIFRQLNHDDQQHAARIAAYMKQHSLTPPDSAP